jgi:hypothetical protein
VLLAEQVPPPVQSAGNLTLLSGGIHIPWGKVAFFKTAQLAAGHCTPVFGCNITSLNKNNHYQQNLGNDS